MAALAAHGFVLEPMPHVLEGSAYLAGSDEDRARDLMNAFTDDRFDAIACSRGGYGTMRILKYLDFERISASPKILLGFSDISALQWALWQRVGLVTFSGPQVARGWGGELPEFSKKCWLEMLTGQAWSKPLPVPEGEELIPVQHGVAEGRLVGGNLAMMASLCGTTDTPLFRDAVVVLEEIDEPLYRIDRMLTQLRLSGAFDGVRGILLGRFVQHVKGQPQDQHEAVVKLIAEFAGDIPMLAGAPYGHVGPMWTLPLGSWVRMDVQKREVVVENRV